ncbi:MAG: Na+/H+ antiporter NhaD/arsenite permease-like protein [Cognaticolwellia sp.]|jgi:Na+/H+ antiporter NhaD/arsenite permease-like protein
MIIKIVLVGLVIFMLYNLFKALFLMTKNDPDKPPMSNFIGRRLMFSGLILVIVLIGVATGLITPHTPPY